MSYLSGREIVAYIMGKRLSWFYASLLLISYVMVSVYWIHKLIDGKKKRFIISKTVKRSQKASFGWHNVSERTRASRPNRGYFEINNLAAMWKLDHFLQSEWHGSNSTEKEGAFDIHHNSISNSSSFLKHNIIVDEYRLNEDKKNTNSSHSRTCKALVSGNDISWKKTIHLLKEKHKHSGPKYRKDDVMLRLFCKCKEIKEFLQPKTSNKILNDSSMQIAYSILLNRPADQTFQLLRAIYDPSNAYCLHVDIFANKKFYGIIRKLSTCFDNIFLSSSRHDVALPTSKRIDAHLSCFKTLLNTSISWRYLFSISGSVYPLRNNTVILDYLRNRQYANGILQKDASHHRFIRRTKFVHVFKEISGVSGIRRFFVRTKKLKQPPPQNITLFRSENTFIATKEFAEFATFSREAKELLAWSRDVRYPDEFFWATLDKLPGAPGGSPFRKDEEDSGASSFYGDNDEDIYSTRENCLVARLSRSNRSSKCGGRYHGNICIFSYVDLRWILNQDNLFAGPFELGVDRIVLECLYQNLQKPLIEDNNF